ncbi:UDP-2,3-diacylglucosamine diphosphatase [Ramlibacter sp. G-1-2-2]|uniref:UDP-2,3-diacylglucosamine hydrolase n=1 Tax=Ramlibacter agri TaxID=2728837 RepID=A0A848H2U1_9BURK|nr:UDP-2,3-diacylglucosamine diphosphatase [Ramlibacter agri]NML45135.1 UDP-2,3-diacylglucosamine diphosphatase [Ramlibacter agri]
MEAAPRAQELVAPQGWRSVEFISDLHLEASQPANFEAWRRYMAATQADAVFILGDLFEAWIGDDSAAGPGFEGDCAEVLRAATRQRPIFFLHGNRDFLLGAGFAATTGVTLLADPTVFAFGSARWLLTHGDALCLDDTEYQAFRRQVRSPAWQAAVLARPLAERRMMAKAIRSESEDLKRTDREYADVDMPAALAWLQAADAAVMIHGHTHKPREHDLDATHRRIVLSDWDPQAQPPRREALRLARDGAWQRVALA